MHSWEKKELCICLVSCIVFIFFFFLITLLIKKNNTKVRGQ
jgi:phosphotransferase system  glucose/maltose/N-acetylglucosamine-specific IIC component